MFTFSFLDKAAFEDWAPRLFGLLHANMEPIAPGAFQYEEWRRAVGAGIRKAPRQIVLMHANGAFAGFFQYYVNENVFMMEEIQFRAEVQGQGAVRKLYRWLIPQFPVTPQRVEAYNHPQNERSHALLARMGLRFQDMDGELRHYAGSFADLCAWLNHERSDTPMNGQELFTTLFPGFFEREGIRNLPDDVKAEEMTVMLRDFQPVPLTCPENITFGFYQGDMEKLRAAVRQVNESWVEYFNEGDRIYCAMDGDEVVSFCLVDEFGAYNGMKVGGPGCVGTVPSRRRQGTGLKMVQNATLILKDEGYDISYIHYTGVGRWYAHIGYETLLWWNNKGFIE